MIYVFNLSNKVEKIHKLAFFINTFSKSNLHKNFSCRYTLCFMYIYIYKSDLFNY